MTIYGPLASLSEDRALSLQPPSDSRISVTTEGGHPRIVVPHGNDSPMRYFVGLFSLAWLGV